MTQNKSTEDENDIASNAKKTSRSKALRRKIITSGFGCALIILLAVFLVYRALPDKTPQQRSLEYKQDLRLGAIAASHILIEDHLKAQKPVKHPEPGDAEESAAINGSNLFTVTSWVENLSDLPSRRKYIARIKYLPPNDRWVLLNVEFTENQQ